MAIASDDELLARAGEIAAHAVAVARGRRRHAPLVFLWTPAGELDVEPLQGRLERPLRAWERVAREVVERDARGVVFVGEGWTDALADDAEESLLVAALCRSGRERVWVAPVRRGRLRIAEVGEPVVAEGLRPDFLAPVRAAWGIEVVAPAEG